MELHKKEKIYTGSRLYPVRISFDDIPDNEPYKTVSGGDFTGKAIEWSPDPLSSFRFNDTRADSELNVFKAYPVKYFVDNKNSFQNTDSVLSDKTDITVKGNGNIVFDFGIEFAAWLEIESPDLPTCESVRLSVSEYNMPQYVNKGPQSPRKTGYPKKIGCNIYRLELNPELYEGVRFGFLHVENYKNDFHITSVRLICQIKPSNYDGSFYCDNEMLNRIWYTAAYCVRTNFKKDYLSAILIDRGDRHSWTGDAYISQKAAMLSFSCFDYILKNLKYTSSHSNGIESYELLWVFSLIDYYYHSADKDGVLDLLPCAEEKLSHAYEVWGKNPSLTFFGWDERQGAGFETPDIYENQFSYKALAIECFIKYAGMLKALDKHDEAKRYVAYARRKTNEITKDDKWYRSTGLHAFSGAVNAGFVSPDIQNGLFDKFLSDRVNRISYCPFNEYFILEALAKAGKYDDALSSVLDLWGGQIIYGGTCFFEVFRPEWNDIISKNAPVPNNQAGYTSLAHPWSSGVLCFISERLLGVTPTSPGYSTFSVIPHMTAQLNVISGEIPTVHGNIKASFDFLSGKHSVTVPDGTRALVAVPKPKSTAGRLTLNGKPAAADREDGEYFYFNDLLPGEYSFLTDHPANGKTYKAPVRKYAARFIKTDTDTKDERDGIYGKDGSVICGKDKNLPDYVEDAVFDKGIITASGYSTDHDNICSQTFTVDIKLKYKRKYTAALYFSDSEGDKSLAVETFDGKTLDMISPVKALNDYERGVYLVYEYDDSVRFRINHVRGDNVSLSGIFFDTN